MKKTALFTALLCLAQSPLHAAVPSLISYQGHVTDATGNIGESAPVNRTITFRIWDSATAIADANRLYAEKMVVTINKGDFSVLLGQGTSTGETMTYSTLDSPLLFNGSDVYLGITVDDGNSTTVDAEITPRQRIVSSAFAMRSRVAESVDSAAITNGMLANNAVNTTQIAGNAVTTAKIAASAVTTTQIADGNVTTAKILDGTITVADIGTGAVTTDKILDGTIATVDIGTGVVTTAKIATDTILAGNIGANQVGTSEIADATVTGTDIADGNVTGADIADATVTGTDIALGTIATTNLSFKPVTGDENLRTIRGTVTAAGVITSGTGFTAVVGTNSISITYTTAFSSAPSVVVSNNMDQSLWNLYVHTITPAGFLAGGALSGAGYGRLPFTFIAIGPR
jgi:hypothetical protein